MWLHRVDVMRGLLPRVHLRPFDTTPETVWGWKWSHLQHLIALAFKYQFKCHLQGFLLWRSGLRIQHCHCCGMGSISASELNICSGHSPPPPGAPYRVVFSWTLLFWRGLSYSLPIPLTCFKFPQIVPTEISNQYFFLFCPTCTVEYKLQKQEQHLPHPYCILSIQESVWY